MSLVQIESLAPRTTKGEVLRLLCRDGGIARALVGRIELQGSTATVEVPAGWEARLTRALDGATMGDRRLRVKVIGGDAGSAAAGDHFGHLGRLLDLESRAEARRALERLRDAAGAGAERSGDSLRGLVLVEESSGLGGRCVLTFARRDRSTPLPWNRLEPGTPVLLSVQANRADDGWPGVVCERRAMSVSVALNSPPDVDGAATFGLDRSTDATAGDRQRSALEQARTAARDRLAELRDVLLFEKAPDFSSQAAFTPLDPSLNMAQQDAVGFALAARDVAVVHGPPGTGKTTAVVELIRQAVRRGERVLACAPSNLAVDNLMERLLRWDEKAVRLGHPARVLPAVRAHTLDLLSEGHGDARQARRLARDAFVLFRRAGKFTRARPEPGARQAMRQEARALLADARRLDERAVDDILDQATVLCATLTGLDGALLGRRRFDLAVIDEAGQSTEPACWLPLLRCGRVVLAGDHCQLPPTIISAEAAAAGLGVSLMERIVGHYGSAITRRLVVQYRMHEAIMAFPSAQFYDETLRADPSIAGHLLCDLPGVVASPLTATAVQFIDTAGAGFDEQTEPGGESRLNIEEAGLVCRKVRALLEAGVPATAIGVIAPYAAQVRLLRERLAIPELEVDSVDGFQGREKEAIVLSMVRSNREGDVGFVADVRRMNVALTRARRKLLLVGDSATLACHPFYAELFDYLDAIGAHGSVWEEPE